MPVIKLEYSVDAPAARVFDLSRSEAKARLGRGAKPSDVANWLHRKRLGKIKILFIFMKATRISLGDAKGLGVWWGPDGVKDAEESDDEAGRLLAKT